MGGKSRQAICQLPLWVLRHSWASTETLTFLLPLLAQEVEGIGVGGLSFRKNSWEATSVGQGAVIPTLVGAEILGREECRAEQQIASASPTALEELQCFEMFYLGTAEGLHVIPLVESFSCYICPQDPFPDCS